jgi:hypothetical protein
MVYRRMGVGVGVVILIVIGCASAPIPTSRPASSATLPAATTAVSASLPTATPFEPATVVPSAARPIIGNSKWHWDLFERANLGTAPSHGDPGVMVASDFGYAAEPGFGDNGAYFSRDGVDWAKVTLPDQGEVFSVAAKPDAIIFGGHECKNVHTSECAATTFTTTDGSTWTESRPFMDSQGTYPWLVGQIWPTSVGWEAVNDCTGPKQVLWRSPDGISWTWTDTGIVACQIAGRSEDGTYIVPAPDQSNGLAVSTDLQSATDIVAPLLPHSSDTSIGPILAPSVDGPSSWLFIEQPVNPTEAATPGRTAVAWSSPDLSHWTATQLPTTTVVSAITSSQGFIVDVADGYLTSSGERQLISSDGIQWDAIGSSARGSLLLFANRSGTFVFNLDDDNIWRLTT